jgi:HK97 family phage portal protein
MKILDSIAARFGYGKAESRPQNVSYSEAVLESFGVTLSGNTVSAASAMRVSAVAACVGRISGSIVSMPLHVYQSGPDDSRKRLKKDSLWYLLNESPSPQYTSASLWEGVSMAQLLRGDAYALIRRSINGSVREILPLPWGSVSPIRTVDAGVRYYVSMPTHGIATWFDPSEILHFPGLGFDDALMKSMSVLQYGAASAVGGAMAMDNYSSKFFEGGAHPSMILEAAGKMNPDQIAALQAAFTAKHAGLENTHRIPLVLTEGLKAKEISISANDAQLIEARRFSVLDICRAFGVPPHLVGETSGSTSWGSGIESMGRAFVQYTLSPWIIKCENELNRKIFPRDSGKFIEFDRDAMQAGDSAAQGAYFRLALGGPGSGDGFMSQNEIRKIKNLPPIDGGDEVFRAAMPVAPPPDTSKQDAAVADVANSLREMRHKNELQSERITNRLDNQPAPAPVVNVAAPVVTVTVEKPDAPIVNNVIHTPEQQITFEATLPEQAAPVVNNIVNVEKPDAPVVNVAPQVVNIAPQVVNVAPAEVNVTLPPRKTDTTIVRDSKGQITQATQTERDM